MRVTNIHAESVVTRRAMAIAPSLLEQVKVATVHRLLDEALKYMTDIEKVTLTFEIVFTPDTQWGDEIIKVRCDGVVIE